ncbi:OST-HTH/LOTUS domain-containing protein [Nocardia sp. NPDC004711]
MVAAARLQAVEQPHQIGADLVGNPGQIQFCCGGMAVGMPDQHQVDAVQPAQLRQSGALARVEAVGAQHDQVGDPVGDQPGCQGGPDAFAPADPLDGQPDDSSPQRGGHVGSQRTCGAGRGGRVDHDHARRGVVHYLSKKQPDFDTRIYGYLELKPLVQALEAFEICQRRPAPGKPAVSYIRCRSRNGVDQQASAR